MKNFTNTLIILLLVTLSQSCKKEEIKTEKAVNKTEKTLNPNAKFETATLKVEGMTCAVGCAKTIEKNLNATNGIKTATVDFDNKKATIEYDSSVQNPEKLIEIIQKTGDGTSYKASL